MPILFDSGALDFAENETQFVEITHNIGSSPKVIQFYGELDGIIGFPTLTGIDGSNLSGPYLENVMDPYTLRVFKPDNYLYAGKFRVCILE
jgi:hypothetical protein